MRLQGGHGLRLPESIGRLVNLQTLDCRFVGSASWLENGLGKLPQLKKLRISDRHFKNSSELYPENLMKLTLQNCDLEEDPMLTLKKLPNLRILKLMGNSCGSKMVCSFGGFFQLEVLGLHWLKKLEELKVEEGALPKLRTLQIRGRKNEKGSSRILQLEKLRELKLKRVSP
ncbi:putative disease resistance protein RF9 [Vitis vinifera]|uniref:Putative disease resistance protein RF9 n=1 Tax=Vitis vinifera TaxID=29760 RepID=A0A438DIH6_VITVI|nr:putative disease resistance protein RF9 [Vitis vinifera]